MFLVLECYKKSLSKGVNILLRQPVLSPLFHLIWTCGAGAVDDKGLDIYIHTILIFDIFSSSSYRGQCVYTPPLMLWGCVWLFMNKSKYLLLVYFLCIFPACYHYVTCSGETEQVADTNVWFHLCSCWNQYDEYLLDTLNHKEC